MKHFEGDEYRDIYETVLELMDELNANKYYKGKWQATRNAWAKEGM